MTNQPQHTIGLVIFPDMTHIDITGPLQVFHFLPNRQIHLLWKTLEPVESNEGMKILPTTTFDDCPSLDVLCVAGGPGQITMMNDPQMLEFLQKQGKTAKFITSVCTGSLVLAGAGLLSGYRAACHWAFRDQLAMLGVEVGTQRVVIDRNRITGGGATAGIDFGLVLAGLLCGEETAKMIELLLEYNPAPPFNVGSPEKAGAALVNQVKTFGGQLIEASFAGTKQAAERLGINQ
ncbi:DJ-1/PfpI family protein [Trichocoleus sp. FACHB-90]|uniref:DJ-1/PfpI family protein n=1 Tax=Cyanophyceae TaxID=3028117 RepID=UPI001685706B|nr:DJ-1/PfpI family protein [Trichocoleus sp. FACHB-90]MBD1925434.1 DJ-1/PfpI family protein [Trichocoleus sp. FACHB-90]